MATCDSVGSTSQYQGSEECYTYECDVCKQENQKEQAMVYCPECEEYLCNSCESWHKKPRATRFHDVVPVTELASKEKPKSQALSCTLKNECGCNTKREAVCFCFDHQELMCSTCKNVRHRKCQSGTIEDMLSKASVFEEFDALTDKTNSLIEHALQLKEHHTNCLESLGKANRSFEQQIHQLRKDLNTWVDKLEENTQAEKRNRVDGVRYVLKKQSAIITDTLQLLNEAKQSIEGTRAFKSEKNIFVINKKFQHPIELYEKTLNEFEKNITRCAVTFERNNEIVDFQQRQDCFGYFSIEGPMATAVGRKVFLRAKAEKKREITLRTPGSKENSQMLAFACTSTGEILIADSKSMLLHLDANLNVKNSIKCTDSNTSLAPLEEEVFVVLTGRRKEISYVAITPTLHISRSIKLRKSCKALAAANQCIYLLTQSTFGYDSPLELLVLDKLGNLIKTLKSSEMDKPLVSISYLALNPTGSKFFVAGNFESTVTCMTTSGESVYVYKDQEMTSPSGIVVDEDDNALVVCCRYSSNIHMIKSDGTRHKILLSDGDVLRWPDCIGYRATDGLLFVGSDDKVLVFKMR